ncbi:hypothetical protein VitviT2T_030435 [Vitis vinifera]|uniref:Uncharacterized protein n=1 Tax=Vitis vinifera TaxID=29760 RepID=A0ABY9E027_VITVI|nr:protein GRAVITROPIC IN THE LIGHT 1-like [Vitis vinifera]WKA13102.1 hypothetical protein VitviT2T_030435 [Vitis vinifera]|eukprot:XP_010644820.1 PREDICTED: uncharacterized protein LOC104877723 [Vitis vinifera]
MPKAKYREREQRAERVMEMEMKLLMSEVFETVSALKRAVKAREVEVKNLKEKLKSTTSLTNSVKKGRFQLKKKVSCNQGQVAALPTPDLFEGTMGVVKEASKSFMTWLLLLMRSAHWDIAAIVRSIKTATIVTNTTMDTTISVVGSHHVKYALESYVCQKIFQGFDHETFYMDGNLSSSFRCSNQIWP